MRQARARDKAGRAIPGAKTPPNRAPGTSHRAKAAGFGKHRLTT